MALKMVSIDEFTGVLKVLDSGLRVGGEKGSAAIGDTDNPIIRHPITHLPYVPGSSVKGKIRSLLESRHCPRSQETGLPCTCGTCLVCQLFGCGESRAIQSPSRLVFPRGRNCANRGWLDEAALRSYRAVELCVQRRLGARFGIDTDAVRPRQVLEPLQSDIQKRLGAAPAAGWKLGLRDAAELVGLLNDPIGKQAAPSRPACR
ncbi:MAG TPA: type III-A CRISPR-associated RAMP protein Csm3 [Planctomycetota bacterium]|nr:type III-A CRISPR-associated RAMP protein Csm3 [Planctomycetota bacterium]